jgi:RimJ/RimL family protein N-acetyltransferase
MSIDPSSGNIGSWRSELPALAGKLVTLREVAAADLPEIVELLSASDASRFGLEPPRDESVQELLERAPRERAGGLSMTWVVVLNATGAIAGLIQVRQLEPSFETAEWECTMAPFARGTGAFVEAARLAGSFTFSTIGAHRIEARTLLQNGRANGALRKLGAVQEGILRRAVRRGGQYYDQALWAILKEDWGPHWVSTGERVH